MVNQLFPLFLYLCFQAQRPREHAGGTISSILLINGKKQFFSFCHSTPCIKSNEHTLADFIPAHFLCRIRLNTYNDIKCYINSVTMLPNLEREKRSNFESAAKEFKLSQSQIGIWKKILKILNLGAMVFMCLESGKPASSLPYFIKVA